MKNIKLIILALLVSISGFAQIPVKWNVDQAHTKIQFTAIHMGVSEVTGEFKKFEGKIGSEDEDFSNTSIEFTIQVASVSTDNDMRDTHLKSDDFFNAEKYPIITFKSKSFKKIEGKKYMLTGDLTIRDVTKSVDLAVIYNGKITDPYGFLRAGFKVAGKINRMDYNLKWNTLMGAGDAVVSNEISFNCNIELTKDKGK